MPSVNLPPLTIGAALRTLRRFHPSRTLQTNPVGVCLPDRDSPSGESGCLSCQFVRGLAIAMSHARGLILDRFRCIGGHADVWQVFHAPEALAAVVRGLAEPFREDGVTAVCGVESLG